MRSTLHGSTHFTSRPTLALADDCLGDQEEGQVLAATVSSRWRQSAASHGRLPKLERPSRLGEAMRRPFARQAKLVRGDGPRRRRVSSVDQPATVPKKVPTLYVTAIANALQNVTRTMPGRSFAPPVFAAKAPSIASATKAAAATAAARFGPE